LQNAGRMGETPDLIWLTAAPGHEEAVLQGIADVVGAHVPIAGGSSADNHVSGQWRQLANGALFNDAVVISVFFSSCELAYAFHSGYLPSDHHGVVTRADGRVIHEINGRPAAEVYNEWRHGAIYQALDNSGSILNLTTFAPLGVRAGDINQQNYYLLVHPLSVTPSKGLRLFAEIKAGDEVWLMEGSRDSLSQRAGRVAEAAVNASELRDIRGALVIYCAGCMLGVYDNMTEVAAGVREALAGAPFLGAFTFGEQGCFMCGANRHGNLMISVVVFGYAG
jgi:hypothetical protein